MYKNKTYLNKKFKKKIFSASIANSDNCKMKDFTAIKQEISSSYFFGLRRRHTFTDQLNQEKLAGEKELPKSKKYAVSSKTDFSTPLILIFISLFTRLLKISHSDYVVWDEAHFGIFK